MFRAALVRRPGSEPPCARFGLTVRGRCETLRRARASRRAAGVLIGFAIAAASGVVASAANAEIYWDNVSANTIGEASGNGKNVDQDFIRGADGPADVVVSGDYIYWSNVTGCAESGSCPGTIARAKLNGTDVDEHFITATTPYGLTVAGGYIYWANSGSNSIGRATVAGADVNQDFITGATDQTELWSMAKASTGPTTARTRSAPRPSLAPTSTRTSSQARTGRRDRDQQPVHLLGEPQQASIGARDARRHRGRRELHHRRRRLADPGDGQRAEHLLDDVDGRNAVPTPGEIGEANLNGSIINRDLISSSQTPVGVFVTAEVPATRPLCRVPNVKRKKLAAQKKQLKKPIAR